LSKLKLEPAMSAAAPRETTSANPEIVHWYPRPHRPPVEHYLSPTGVATLVLAAVGLAAIGLVALSAAGEREGVARRLKRRRR
jgi:hypothetical protein